MVKLVIRIQLRLETDDDCEQHGLNKTCRNFLVSVNFEKNIQKYMEMERNIRSTKWKLLLADMRRKGITIKMAVERLLTLLNFFGHGGRGRLNRQGLSR